MRVERQPCPILGFESRWVIGQRRVRWHRLVAREHAATEKAVASGVGRELVIAVQIPVTNALFESIDDACCFTQLHDAPDFDTRTQPQLDSRDDAEQAVAADRQAKETWIGTTRARAQLTVRTEQVERLHLLDDGLQRQSTSVRVARQRASEAQSICTGLLLVDSPLPIASLLRPVHIIEKLRPLNPALDADD